MAISGRPKKLLIGAGVALAGLTMTTAAVLIGTNSQNQALAGPTAPAANQDYAGSAHAGNQDRDVKDPATFILPPYYQDGKLVPPMVGPGADVWYGPFSTHDAAQDGCSLGHLNCTKIIYGTSNSGKTGWYARIN